MVRKWCAYGALTEGSVQQLFYMEFEMKKTGYYHDKPCKDHKGNSYPNIKAMCSFWGILPETYTRRINVYGLSTEEALTRPVKHNGGLRCSDHTGRKYRSRSMMCRYWNIDRKLFEYRLSHGWSLEDALTKERRQSNGRRLY